ncbi:MAG: DUF6435 family protein [Cellvibrionaceae bacterium]
MFTIFKKNPIKKLEKQYYKKLEEAMHAQRNGDIKSYSMITAEAEAINVSIEKLTIEREGKIDK